jgi:hypothetical protein
MHKLAARLALTIATATGFATAAEARTCSELRSLCWTMRDDKSDCAKPYQRCLNTGVFITPLGRVFKATK